MTDKEISNKDLERTIYKMLSEGATKAVGVIEKHYGAGASIYEIEALFAAIVITFGMDNTRASAAFYNGLNLSEVFRRDLFDQKLESLSAQVEHMFSKGHDQ